MRASCPHYSIVVPRSRDLPLHWGGTAKREIIRRLNKGAGNLAGPSDAKAGSVSWGCLMGE